MSYYSASSPPPLQHPVPTHPPYIPEPPSAPGTPSQSASYLRFTSSPNPTDNTQPMHPNQRHHAHGQPAYGQAPYASTSSQYQSFAGSPPQVHGTIPAVPIENYAAQWGVDGATAQLGVKLGQSAVAAGQEYVQKNVRMSSDMIDPCSILTSSIQFGDLVPHTHLKHHFNVSNSYVLRKLGLVIFPWRHRPWTRRIRRSEINGQTEGWQPPREDINSPDLYIPSMLSYMPNPYLLTNYPHN